MEVENKNLSAARVQALRGTEYQCLFQEPFHDVPSSHSTKLPRSTSATPALVVLPRFVPVSSSRL